jgi:dynein heavy chain
LTDAVQKVTQTVRNPILGMCLHKLPSEKQKRVVYFLRNTSEPIPQLKDLEGNLHGVLNSLDAEKNMPKYLDMGHIGDMLDDLERLLDAVFYPILGASASKDSHSTDKAEADVHKEWRSDFLASLKRFLNEVSHTSQQVHGGFSLNIPTSITLEQLSDLASVKKDQKLMESADRLANEWVDLIKKTLSEEAKRIPLGDGPLPEIDFWRRRASALTPIYEQLQSPIVQRIAEVCKLYSNHTYQSIEHQISELKKSYIESKDNAKFLSTLERHFKNIITGTLVSVKDSLPSLMNAIRMVWIISRHYNRDDRMVPLMARIAWEIANKVYVLINVKNLFREPSEEAKQKVRDAKDLLEGWSKAYFETRERIEQSGRDQRWEFDRKKLFERTNYMALRCGDLYEILEVVGQFYSIFGPELKAVTGDPEKIDDVVKRVDALVVPFRELTFDIFSKE